MFALLLAAGCNSEPTEDLRNGIDQILATPSQLFLEVGETKTVEVTAVDEQGNPLTFAYEVTSTGAGITVRRDSTFLPIWVDDTTLQVPPQGERFRFIVEGTAYTSTSFTVSAGGEELVIPVQVIPQSGIEATFSNPTPALGEVVTITAPAGTRFSPTSVVTAPGDVQPFLVSVAADGSSLDVILPPNLTEAQLTISDVVADAAPDVPFAPTTTATITTPAVTAWTGTVSNPTPAANEEVTVTLTDATLAADASLILGAGNPTITNLTPTAVSFIPAPGSTGLLVINGVVLNALPQIPLNLPAAETDTITVGPVAAIGGTEDPGTAPTLITPGVGFSSVLFDQPDYANFVDHYYKLVVTQAGVYTVTMNWDIGADIDMFLCNEDLNFAECDFQAATGAHPEVGVYALDPGTYYIIGDDYAGDAAGTTLQINVDHAAPAPPAVVAAKAKATSVKRK